MAAYMIVNIDVKDSVAYGEYSAKVPALIRKYGGEALVLGGRFQVVEGTWKPTRIIVLRFADMAAIQGFYDDPDYQPLKSLRQRATNTEMVFVEGV
jgi:uncharacterized protein (DUF1330 family)